MPPSWRRQFDQQGGLQVPSRNYRPYKRDGERLRRARKRLGLSAATVAEAVGYEVGSIYAVEYGARKPDAQHIIWLVNEARGRGVRYPALAQEILEEARRASAVELGEMLAERRRACAVCVYLDSHRDDGPDGAPTRRVSAA